MIITTNDDSHDNDDGDEDERCSYNDLPGGNVKPP